MYRRLKMWPYNHCEWKTITYGITEAKKKTKKLASNNMILAASAIPSLILILGIIYAVIG